MYTYMHTELYQDTQHPEIHRDGRLVCSSPAIGSVSSKHEGRENAHNFD